MAVKPRVLIVGAGFGGLAAAKALHRAPVDVIVLDRHDYHVFTPFLYQVATSLLEADDAGFPVRGELRRQANASFRVATVKGVDLAARSVQTDRGDLDYDYLIIAAGAVNNYFGHAETAEHSLGLNDLPEALELRNRILGRFEEATWATDPLERARLLRFAVVGGGPTGVEFAGALAELVAGSLAKDFPEIDPSEVNITLAEASDEPLSSFSGRLPTAAHRRLEARGIDVRSGVRVIEVDDEGLQLQDKSTVAAATVVWAAGVRASHLSDGLGVSLGSHGRVKVTPSLQVPAHPEVFAVGDVAEIPDGSAQLPMLAQVAIQSGRHAARNVETLVAGGSPSPLRYKDLGTMATVGRNFAVAQIGRLQFSGLVGFLAWLVVHIARIVGVRTRWLVLANWVSGYLFGNRPVRLITGPRVEPRRSMDKQTQEGQR
jgi:NADH dehydrogenase